MVLADRIEPLCRELLPCGRRGEREWACGDVRNIPARRRGSLRVALSGPYRGHWRDWSTDEHGDALDLVAAALGLDVADAMAWARSWLGHDDARGRRPIRLTATAPTVQAPDAEEARRSTAAYDLWRRGVSVGGTIGERYLRHRGIAISAPASLRYLANAKHGPSALILPALLAGITIWPGRRVVAVQRTFLRADGYSKATVSQPRMSLGPTRGGAVHLGRVEEHLALAEGIEDALAVAQATGLATWATLGASGLRGVVIPEPPLAARVTIFADADEAGEAAARELAQRLAHEGRDVRIARPPDGFKDFAEIAERRARHAA